MYRSIALATPENLAFTLNSSGEKPFTRGMVSRPAP